MQLLPSMRCHSFRTWVLLLAAATLYSVFSLSAFSTPTQSQPNIPDGNGRLDFWQKRWDSGTTRWRRPDIHPSLQQFTNKVFFDYFPSGGARILVPLCGKTVDMAHLATKRKVGQVVGIDGVRKAVEAFAQENPDLEVKSMEACPEKVEKWQGNSITLIIGDFFEVDKTDFGEVCDGAWDRGSLVAIKPERREKYVEQIGKLMNKDGRILLSTFVHRNRDKSPSYAAQKTKDGACPKGSRG